MSRVHDALRKAARENSETPQRKPPVPTVSEVVAPSVVAVDADAILDMESILAAVAESPYAPLPEALLINYSKPREAPGEEFRTLRTRLNHLQTLQPLHTLVITSASPAEGKSFTATNLALTQAQLTGRRVILGDFDFRRPTVDKTFGIKASPGITDYLQGNASLSSVIRKIAGTNLYVMTAGGGVPNPLELLNLQECKQLIDSLREYFDWVIIDSPPLLFAADGNLLATMSDGTILVVRIGSTTFDAVTRALQSLCENNVLGIVVNGARRGELYSKYTYYHDYYGPGQAQAEDTEAQAVDAQNQV
jgi:protein-tyrosine kinase